MKISTPHHGFTSIELFITIGILAVIAGIALFIFHPIQRYREVRDRERLNEIQYIGNALGLCIFNNNGRIPEKISAIDKDESYIIGSSQEGSCGACGTIDTKDSCFDISKVVCDIGKFFVPEYISSLPIDPNELKWDEKKTGYYISKISNNGFVIGACNPEGGIIKIQKEF